MNDVTHEAATDETPEEFARRLGAFRALHSFVLTAILTQPDEENRHGLIDAIGGFDLSRLHRAIKADRVRLQPFVLGEEMSVRVFVRTPSGDYVGLCHPPVHCLGMVPSDPLYETWLSQALTFRTPDDLSDLDG